MCLSELGDTGQMVRVRVQELGMGRVGVGKLCSGPEGMTPAWA